MIMLSFRTLVANDLLKSFQADLPAKSPLFFSSRLEMDGPIPCLIVQIMANLCRLPNGRCWGSSRERTLL